MRKTLADHTATSQPPARLAQSTRASCVPQPSLHHALLAPRASRGLQTSATSTLPRAWTCKFVVVLGGWAANFGRFVLEAIRGDRMIPHTLRCTRCRRRRIQTLSDVLCAVLFAALLAPSGAFAPPALRPASTLPPAVPAPSALCISGPGISTHCSIGRPRPERSHVKMQTQDGTNSQKSVYSDFVQYTY